MSCATKTKAQLATAVMHEFVAIDATETEADHPETSVLVQAAYDVIYDRLEDDDSVYWDLNAIPTSAFFIMRDFVMNEVSGAFGEPQPSEVKEAREQVIMRRLKRHTGHKGTGSVVRAEYF